MEKFENIVETWQEALFRFAFFRVGSSDAAADIVQNVFVALYDRSKGHADIADMKSYLYRATANACVDHIRRRDRFRFFSLDSVRGRAAAEPNEYVEEFRRIERLMEGLPPEQTEVIRMYAVDGLRFTEIAAILEIPVTTVKSRFKYGIDKLKKAL